MRSISILFIIAIALFTQSPSALAAVIPADALIGFQVEAFAPVGNGPYTTHVGAWESTGLFLNAGDIFALQATGIVWIAPPFTPERSYGPDGDGALFCHLQDNVERCIADIPNSRYSLVGKIGTDLGDEFFVGSDFSGIANDTGILYLALNDSHYFDNTGFFVVSTTQVPEPDTALLLSLGLLGLATQGRRFLTRTGRTSPSPPLKDLRGS